MAIQISGDHFTRDGRAWFYLADTAWSAFTSATAEQWTQYLALRRQQGFTVLQLNVLPQWDRSVLERDLEPFERSSDGTPEWGQWKPEYFERARAMCRAAKAAGFELALVGLWLNYVPDTWGSEILGTDIMPKALIGDYVDMVHAAFAEFEPIWVVGGDTDLESDTSIAYYTEFAARMRQRDPNGLQTIHVKRDYSRYPDALADVLDFFCYQSGHNPTEQHVAYELAERLRMRWPDKPVVNAEPCYEQMGYSRRRYGRFSRGDTRRAAWWSVLSGASAGLGYGAHGVWNWHFAGARVDPALGEGFDEAQPWDEALRFEGAWDYGVIRAFLEPALDAGIRQRQNLLISAPPEVRCAQVGDRLIVYVPSAIDLTLSPEVAGLEVQQLGLESGRIAWPRVSTSAEGVIVHMTALSGDSILVLRVGAAHTDRLSDAHEFHSVARVEGVKE